ncbi:MAG TPA: hypothetical protein P5543_09335 [Planctomycetota bacterium]|nr:hypothetical protein [Planctomycetota bacterium]HRU52382.1 hypothetical protein [Planctomycetota bacterium]
MEEQKKVLRILKFGLICRNMVDIGKPEIWLSQLEFDEKLQDIFGESTENFEIETKVFKQVCGLAINDIVHFKFPYIDYVENSQFNYFSEETLKKFISKNRDNCLQISVQGKFHKSGILQARYHKPYDKDENGYHIQTAIDMARLNLKKLAIHIPEKFCELLSIKELSKRNTIATIGNETWMIGSLKDFTSEILGPVLRAQLKKTIKIADIRDTRCMSSTLIQIYKTDPICNNINEFIQVEQYGKEIRGLGSLDSGYHTRHADVITKSFEHNLSNDEEAAVFTFGLSDLLLFNETFKEIVHETQNSKKIQTEYAAILYNTTHYSCILDWVYLEKYLIDIYSDLFLRKISQKNTRPEQMLQIQKQSMNDLIAYQTEITPYPSRQEFLTQVRIAHKIPELQEKFERKRDLSTDYVIQEYTLRTNKTMQFINVFMAATACFSLMEVILTICEQSKENITFWSWITIALFLSIIFIVLLVNKIVKLRLRKKLTSQNIKL